ncbi:MAG: hypothetical protein FWF02_07920 [Micrococcales bacterium]|nr:hypothetical protein [Micrococcales bacterium]MCL2667617.1 hypothetical protein [Micrococcales bacterium]
MSNLTPYSGGGGLTPGGGLLSRYSGVARETNRELVRVQGQAMIRALQTDVEARLADIKIGAAAGLGTSAQQHVATMTAMEGELVKAVPLAAARLEMIGNITAIGTTEIVTDAIAKLRRI